MGITDKVVLAVEDKSDDTDGMATMLELEGPRRGPACESDILKSQAGPGVSTIERWSKEPNLALPNGSIISLTVPSLSDTPMQFDNLSYIANGSSDHSDASIVASPSHVTLPVVDSFQYGYMDVNLYPTFPTSITTGESPLWTDDAFWNSLNDPNIKISSSTPLPLMPTAHGIDHGTCGTFGESQGMFQAPTQMLLLLSENGNTEASQNTVQGPSFLAENRQNGLGPLSETTIIQVESSRSESPPLSHEESNTGLPAASDMANEPLLRSLITSTTSLSG